MSEAPEPTVPPLPHLGISAPGGQSWSSPTIPGDLLTIGYEWTKGDYLRCQFRLLLLRTPTTLLGALGYGLAMTVITGMRRFTATHSISPTLILVFLFSTLFFFVGTLFFTVLILLIVSLFARRMPRLAAITAAGFRETGSRSPRVILWSQIARIVEWKGDLYLVNFVGRGNGLTIPRTAFVDSDAAKRFHTALVALWKANGNRNAVPEPVRAEFFPPS